MACSQQRDSGRTKITAANSGQASMEFALIVGLMLVLLCVVIDFSRAISYLQVMAGLSREGSNLASRGTSLPASAAAVIAGATPLNLGRNGEVIVTSVTNINKVNTITGQATEEAFRVKAESGREWEARPPYRRRPPPCFSPAKRFT